MDEVEDLARRINYGIPLDIHVWYRGERRLYRDIVADWLMLLHHQQDEADHEDGPEHERQR